MQLDRIHVPGNVRSLDVEHVQALAGSIRLQGVLVPVVVSPATGEVAAAGWEFELVAGFHRVAAAAELGLKEIPVVVRLAGHRCGRAIENIARKHLRADDEARAVKAMLDRGLSEDGAAQALGWPQSAGHRADETARASRPRPRSRRRRGDRAERRR